ncbi:MAG: type VI secretion system baseplate subunit TssK [Phycisphaerae bacterium]
MDSIHFSEGLFLQPHHLQLLQRNVYRRMEDHHSAAVDFPYGLVEMGISAEGLKNLLVRFDQLRAVMPSGLEVRYPQAAELPSLNIKDAFESSTKPITILLAVPLWSADRPNVLDGDADYRIKSRYRASELQLMDENTGANPQPIAIRRLNARLMIEGEDTSDMETLPLLRIVHGTGDDVGLPRQDSSFVPPCLVIRGSALLRDSVREFANQVEASRAELALQLGRGGFAIDTMRGAQFEQALRLHILSQYSARFSLMQRRPTLTPFEFYAQLREMLAELSSLYPDQPQIFAAPPYNHDKPLGAMLEIMDKIRSLLRGAVAARFLKADFAYDAGAQMFKTTLSDEQLTAPSEYFLAIRTREDPIAVAKLAENQDQFQVAAPSMVGRRIFGLKLQEERYPPVELPAQVGLNYFRINRADSKRMWDKICEEKGIGIRWLGIETTDYAITLYMTMPT